MTGSGLASATRFLALALSALYATAAVVVLLFESTHDAALWALLLLAGSALLAAGQLLLPTGTASAALISVGAVIGGLPLFWTLLVPVAVAAVVACSVTLARR